MKWIGHYKRLFDRVRNYISSVNFLMLGYLFVKETGWSDWYLLTIPLLFVLAYFDAKIIHPAESESVARKNPILMEIYKKVKEL